MKKKKWHSEIDVSFGDSLLLSFTEAPIYFLLIFLFFGLEVFPLLLRKRHTGYKGKEERKENYA